MATTKKKYEQKAITTTLRFTSRASININDAWYTIEACEERTVPDVEGVDVDQERKLLWDALNMEVDGQLTEIRDAYKKKK